MSKPKAAPLTPTPTPTKRGGHKAARLARRKAYYGARPQATAANKRRAIARHVRRYPEEMKAREVFAKTYGQGALDAQLEKITGKAIKRAKRRAKAARK